MQGPRACNILFFMEEQPIQPARVILQMILRDAKLLDCCTMLYTTKWATYFEKMFDC